MPNPAYLGTIKLTGKAPIDTGTIVESIKFVNGDFRDAVVDLEVAKISVGVVNIRRLNRVMIDHSSSMVFDSLEEVIELEINASQRLRFPSFHSVHSVIIQDITLLEMDWENVSIKGFLELGPSVPPAGFAYSTVPSGIISIGHELTIREHSDTDLSFDQLTTIGGNVNISGNKNCEFHFDKLTRLLNLSMVDNPNSTLPGGFLDLEDADNIHLNGNIDT